MTSKLPPENVETIEDRAGEHTASQNWGRFSVWENRSLKTQQVLTASFAAMSSAITVFVVFFLEWQIIPQDDNLISNPLIEVGLAALLGAIAAGMTVFTLEQMTINRLYDILGRLPLLFDGLLPEEAVNYPGEPVRELAQLDRQFNQIKTAIETRIEEAQQQAEEQEEAKEALQQLLQEAVEIRNQPTAVSEATAIGPDRGLVMPDGSVLSFLDNIQQGFNFQIARENSSTLEEIKQQKEELEYRSIWLEALLYETQLELASIEKIQAQKSEMS